MSNITLKGVEKEGTNFGIWYPDWILLSLQAERIYTEFPWLICVLYIWVDNFKAILCAYQNQSSNYII